MSKRQVEFPISDHAVLRWLERRYGLDIAAERTKIAGIVRPHLTNGSSTIKVDGLKIVLRNGGVVTVLLDGMTSALHAEFKRRCEADGVAQ